MHPGTNRILTNVARANDIMTKKSCSEGRSLTSIQQVDVSWLSHSRARGVKEGRGRRRRFLFQKKGFLGGGCGGERVGVHWTLDGLRCVDEGVGFLGILCYVQS
jgi:hypothetical protein